MYHNEIVILVFADAKRNVYHTVVMKCEWTQVHVMNASRTHFGVFRISVMVFQKFCKQILLIIG